MTVIFLVGLELKKISFLWRNFKFKARSNNFPKYTKIAYFVIYSFTQLLMHLKTYTGKTTNSTLVRP